MFIFFIIIAMMVVVLYIDLYFTSACFRGWGGEGIFFCGVVLGSGWVTGGGEGEKAERRKRGT